ncbi:MAG: DUF2116 family Zn-ribbon domain-containing protein [Thaumarchaeota archaeon]|nr:DUF2116 family Zn-ribbon domain-containing protein [Nitrososphaerota archaeon]
MSTTIPAHKHCRICGRSMPANREYCSNECRDKAGKGEKKAKRMSRIWLLVLVVLMFFFIFSSVFLRPT